jgi:hypothetical protein
MVTKTKNSQPAQTTTINAVIAGQKTTQKIIMKKIFIALTLLVFMASACNQNRPQQNNVTIENNTTAG